ncbi:hypothetical protein ASF30_00530 [Leifsonia sp. Leaf264]|nr:hypothetical protein ASF30_00530 [Leifsonia sp. Leaf264]
MFRVIGNTLLWVLAGVGVLSGVLWAAHAVGWVQPLVVVSGSMQPEIRKGDLLLAIPAPVENLAVGDVASLPNPRTGVLVTHRIVAISQNGSGWLFEMEGDANNTKDPAPYAVTAGTMVWHPVVTVPAVGDLIQTIARPGVAIPLGVAVIALVILTMLPTSGARPDEESAADDTKADADRAGLELPTEEGTVAVGTASERAAP